MADQPFDEKALFLEAIEIARPEERGEYLDAACRNDPHLRAGVEALLREHERTQSLLDDPGLIAPMSESLAIAERPGQTIGHYKLLQEIGEGGFGVVYMAEQREPVRRKVALKIIKPGMDTRMVVARFESERQALALMDHPNIAHVLDAGATQLGRPYFVMELVHGLPLTEYCDQNDLTTRERLELFLQVCHAVQHAHQKGIIHRDLKPSNVMVTLYDGVPVAKVIDFGVAKATSGQLTDKTAFTGYGQMIGTPLYMSPEQAELSGLDVDTRSDIYSLGVVLYELLTGQTPFDQERLREAGFDEVRRMIREDEPPRPSQRISTLGESATAISAHRKTDPARLSRLLRHELDWIVMKAVQKDRTQRYQTASDFARDVERYLADEPIEAQPPTLADRLAKGCRRHRPLVWASAAVLAIALVASLVSSLLIADAYEHEKAQRAAAVENEVRARTGEQLAKEQEELAKRQEALAKEQQKIAVQQRAEAERQRKLAEDAGKAERMAKEAEAGQRRRAEEAAQAERKAREAETLQRLRAEENVKLAVAVLEEMIMKEARQRLAPYLMDEAKELPKPPEREALERKFLDKGLTFYEQLAQTNATDWTARRQSAMACVNVGLLQMDLHNAAEHERALRQAIHLMEELAKERPSDFDNRYDFANTHTWLPTPSLEAAEKKYRHALALFEKLAVEFPEHGARVHERVAACESALAPVLQRAGKLQEAAKYYRSGIAAWESRIAEYKERTEDRDRFRLSLCYRGLSETQLSLGEHREAVKTAEKLTSPELHQWQDYGFAALLLGRCMVLACRDTQLSPAERKTLLDACAGEAKRLIDEAGQQAEATPETRDLREALRLGPDDPQGQYHLGNMVLKLGAWADAEAWYRQALRVRPDFPDAHGQLGYSLWKQGKHAEAEAECREALRLRPGDPGAHFTLGLVLYWGGKTPAAHARFCAEAFAAHPKMADDLRFPNRYNAACAAALAGCGGGQDTANLDEMERARLQRQALEWLRADLTGWRRRLEKEQDKAQACVQKNLRYWQQDCDFAGVRGSGLDRLPEAERQPWQQLWTDVEETLHRARQDTKDAKKK